LFKTRLSHPLRRKNFVTPYHQRPVFLSLGCSPFISVGCYERVSVKKLTMNQQVMVLSRFYKEDCCMRLSNSSAVFLVLLSSSISSVMCLTA
jgi:hypothetical protein